MFAWGDAAAAGANEAARQQKQATDLQAQLADIAYRQALIRQAEAQDERLRQQMDFERQKFEFDKGQAETAQRQRTNQQGVQTMVGELIRREGITPQNRGQIIGTLVEAGRMPTQQDLEDPQADVERARAIAEAQYSTAAKYRAPASQGSLTADTQWVKGPDGKLVFRVPQAGDSPYDQVAARQTTTGADGGAPNVGSLPAAIKDDLITMGTLHDMANQAERLGNSIGWSGVGGMGTGSISQFAAKNLGLGDKTGKEQELRNIIGNITATLARLRGGTSFTTNEQALLEQYTPTINDGDAVIQAKLRSLRQFIQTKRDNTLRVAGGDMRLGTDGPSVGEQRTINGQLAEWDGKGWLPVGRR